MMINFPSSLEEHLKKFLKETFLKKGKAPLTPFHHRDLLHFAWGADKLSTLFTEERSDLPEHYYDDPRLRSGYLLYFFPINFVKMLFVFHQIPDGILNPRLRVADLGSGPAVASLAFHFWNQEQKYSLENFLLLDTSAKALSDGRCLLASFSDPKRIPIRCVRSHLMSSKLEGRFDLLLLSHVFNEIKDPQQRFQRLSKLFAKNLAPGGLVVLVEPALRRLGRDLMTFRDQCIVDLGMEVLAPCLHQEKCPMAMASKKDWCHFYIPWKQPDYLKTLDKLLGNDNSHLKCSYLILRKSEKKKKWSQKEMISVRTSPLARVVSNNMETKGKRELLVCSEAGLTRLMRLDRNKSETNEDFENLRRGDLLLLEGLQGFEVDRVLKVGINFVLKKYL